MISLSHIYHDEVPDFLYPYLESRAMQRLKDVDMNCGMRFTSFPRFSSVPAYSRYHHSLGTALIVWHFTKDRVQTLAALFHDISTPAFSHVADFVKGDHMKQESTENETAELIMNDQTIMAGLKKDHIDPASVSDYHLYPLADNDSPRLCADRLEYICGGIISFGFGSEEEVRKLYENISAGINEEGLPELVFFKDEYAAQFAILALKCGRIYSCDEDRYAMERLALLIRKAYSQKILFPEDLWKGDQAVIGILENSALHEEALNWRRLCRVVTAAADDPEGLTVNTKKRYIDPLGPGGRVSSFCEEFRQQKEAFLGLDYNYPMKGLIYE